MLKIGLVVRANDRGLGVQSWEFYRHLKPYKTIAVSIADDDPKCLERFPDAFVCKGQVGDQDYIHFQDCDVVLSFETFYNDRAVAICREIKLHPKFILQPNYEQACNPEIADGLIVPSVWHFNDWKVKKAYLPVPIDRERLPFKLRNKAEVFVHNAGTQLSDDRNGTIALLRAMPYVHKNITVVIRIQKLAEKLYNEVVELARKDFRVEIDTRTFSNYWDLWDKGDVFIYPRAYGGLALPTNEAMSVGMPVIMPNIKPQNEFLPRELLIEPESVKNVQMFRQIEACTINPRTLGAKIDSIAGSDITHLSLAMDEVAKHWSWESLKSKYINILKNYANN